MENDFSCINIVILLLNKYSTNAKAVQCSCFSIAVASHRKPTPTLPGTACNIKVCLTLRITVLS